MLILKGKRVERRRRSRAKAVSVRWTIVMFAALVVSTAGYFLYPPSYEAISWPEGKAFAFSIVDDTDLSTLENVKPIYDYLCELDLRTTKTVWALPTNKPDEWPNTGHTLQDSAYKAFVLELYEKGFEIALHGARGGSSTRADILDGLEILKEMFGELPRMHINHYRNQDNLYWGAAKFSFVPSRLLYRLMKQQTDFGGHDPQSEFFWGDIARQHITYVVNFSFFKIDLLKVNPSMPYHNPDMPYVNYWFHTSDGGAVESFIELLAKENLDRLEEEGGVCLVYTHFGREFCVDGEINPEVAERLRDVALRNGWFAPASEILDYIRRYQPDEEGLSYRNKVRLELYWLWEKLFHGTT